MQDAWIARVLGVSVASAPASEAKPPESAMDVRATWRDAKESTDAALSALASELRTYGDPDLERMPISGCLASARRRM